MRKMLLERMDNIEYSVSATTRPKRCNENECDYQFMTEEEFNDKKANGYFAETAAVHGYMYGTPRENIDNAIAAGRDIVMDLDIKGALSIMDMYKNAVTIFIMAQSIEVLRERLAKRGTDSEDVIEHRMENAVEEISQRDKFDYIVINEDIEKSYSEIEKIIIKERNKI